MSLKDEFQDMAEELINEDFVDFKEEFIFTIEGDEQVYNDEIGDYDTIDEYIPVEGIPLKISRDLLASGIYSSSDIKIIFKFNEVPIEVNIGVELERTSSGKKYTIEEYIPDVADATITIIAKGV